MSGALRIMVMRDALPVHQGVFGFFGIAMRKCCPLNARGKSLSEDKKHKNSGNKPTHAMKVRDSESGKIIGVFRYGPSDRCW